MVGVTWIVIGGDLWVVGALPIQGDLQVGGVTWKGRRWRFEGHRRACRVAGCTLHTVVWYTLNTVVVVYLKHWCDSP